MRKIRTIFLLWVIGLLFVQSSGNENVKKTEQVVNFLVQLGTPEKERSKSFPLQISALEFSPDGKKLASGRRNGSIVVWNMETNSIMYEIKGYDDFIKRILYGFEDFIRFRPEGTSFLTFSEDKKINEWNAHTGKQMGTPFISLGKPHLPEAYSPPFDVSSSGKLISCQINQDIVVMDAKSGKKIQCINTRLFISTLAFSPDEKCLLTLGSYDCRSVRIWNIESGEEIWTKSSSPAGDDIPFLSGCAFSPDGKFFALATDSYWGGATIQLWKYPTLEESHILKVRQGHIKFAFSPDGKYIAASGLNPVVEIFEIKTGNKIMEFKAHDKRVYAITFSPDGKTLATGSEDTTIKIWDMTGIHSEN